MPTIDNRLVQMQFDNAQFERGVSKSLSTLEKLKQALKFDKVGESLQNIQTSFNNVDLSRLEEGINDIADKFTFVGNLGQTAMRKISESALDAAKNIFNMVSGINNIKAGEAKYQTRTKAVQTITNATGKSVADVEKVLDRLQKYTDDTSADFTEMVNSIGKFTSVGIELGVAEKAMEGISNEAYKSGASRMEAGRAMYNFAQALSSGAVKLIDWKSIENANMATREFKEELIRTAIELGTISKKTDTVGKIMKQTKKATKTAAAEFKETEVSYKTFNETLSQGWLTSDVLIKTLNKYADTTTELGASAFAAAKEYLTFGDVMDTIADTVSSSWMRTFQAIFGNLDEARKLWTRVGDSIVDLYSVFSEYRVSLVENWHELGGYEKAIEAASNLWHTFRNIVIGAKEALEHVFPPITAQRLVQVTEQIRKASAQLLKTFGLYEEAEEGAEGSVTETTPAMKRLQNTVTIFASVLKVVLESFKAIGKIAKSVLNMIMPLIKVISRLSSMFKDMFYNFIEAINQGDIYSKFANTVIGALKPVGDFILQVAKSIELFIATYAKFLKKTGRKNTFDNFLMFLGGYIKTFTKFGFLVDIIKIAINTVGKFASLVKQTLNLASSKIKAFGEQWGWIRNFDQFLFMVEYYLSKIPFIGRLIKSFEGNLLTGIKNRLVDFVVSIIKAFKHGDVKSISSFFTVLYSSFKTAIKGTKLGDFVDTVENTIKTIVTLIVTARNKIVGIVQKITGKIKGFIGEWKFMFSGIDEFLFTIEYFLSKIPVIGSLFRDANGAFNGDILIGIKNRLVDFVKSVSEAFKNGNPKSINEFMSALITNFKNSKFGGLIFDYLSSLQAVITEFIKSIDQLVSSIVSGGKSSVNRVSNSGIGGLLESLLKIITNVNRFISGFLEELNNSGTLFSIGQLLVSVFRLISTLGEMIYNEITNLLGLVSDRKVKTSLGGFLSNVSRFVAGLAKGLNVFLSTYRKFLEVTNQQNTISTFLDFTSRYLSVNSEKIGSAISNIAPILTSAVKGIKNALKKIQDAFRGKEINSVGDFFGALWEGIKNAIPLLERLSEIVGPILIGLVKAIDDFLEKLSSAFRDRDINTFSDFFGALFEGLGRAIPVETIFQNVSRRIVNAFSTSVTWISTKIFGIINGAFTEFSENNPFAALIEAVQSFFGQVPGEADRMVQTITDAADQLEPALSNLNWAGKEDEKSIIDKARDTLQGIIRGVMSMFWPALTAIAVKSFHNFSKGFKEIGKNFEGIVDAIKAKAGVKEDTIGTTVMKIVLSIGGMIVAIGGMIAILSTIDPQKLENGVNVIKTIVFNLALLAGIFTGLQKNFGGVGDIGSQMLKFTGSISAFAIGLLLLIGVFKWGFKPENSDYMTKALIAVGVLFAVFAGLQVGLAIIAAKLGNGNANASITGILDICKGIVLIAIAFGGIAFIISKTPKDSLNQVWITLGGMLIALGSISVLMAWFASKSQAGVVQSSIKGIMSIAGAILLITLAMANVALNIKIFGSDSVWSAFTMLGALLVGMGVIAVLFAKDSTDPKEMKQKSAALAISMLAMVAALGVAAYAISKLSTVLAHVPMGIVITELAGLFAIIGAMGSVAVLFQKFGSSGKDGILKSVSLVISMVGMAIAIGIVAEALSKASQSIKDVEWTSLAAFEVGILGTILLLTHVIQILQAVPLLSFIKVAAGIGIAIALIGTGIGLAIGVLGTFAGAGLEAASQALWILGSDLSGFSDNISGIDWDNVGRVVNFMVNDVLAMWTTVAQIDFNAFYEKMLLFARSGASIWLFGTNISSITEETLAASERVKAMLDKLKETMEVANQISIPEFVSNGGLTQLGSALANYSDGLLQITSTPENSSNAKTIANDAKDISDAISQITTATTAEETLTMLGAALKLYYDMLNDISTDENGNVTIPTVDSQMISQAFEALTSAIPTDEIEMLASYVSGGDNDMIQASLGITALGTALGSYADNIGTLTSTNVGAANDVLNELINLNDSINPRDIFGRLLNNGNETTFSSFAEGIRSLGTALGAYGDNIGTLKTNNVRNANKVLDELMKLDAQLQKENREFNWTRFFSFLQGDQQNLTSFADDVKLLGESLGAYGENIGKLKVDDITNANNVIDTLLETSKDIPASGGLLKKLFAGDNSLGGFASNIGNLAEGVAEFARKTSEANFDNVSTATDFITTVVGVMGGLESSGGIVSWFTGDKSLKNVAKGFADFGIELNKFAKNTTDVNFEHVNSSLEMIEKLIGWGDKFSTTSVNLDNTGQKVDIFTYISDRISTMLTSISNLHTMKDDKGESVIDNLLSLGKAIVMQITKGIKDEEMTSDAIDAISTLMSTLNSTVRSLYDDFYDTGKYVVEGLVAGLTDAMSLESLRKAGITLAVVPTQANRDEFKVKSPSREFEWTGQMCALGLKNGISKYGYLVTDSAVDVATATLTDIMGAFDKSKLGDISKGAMKTVESLFIKWKGEKYTKEDLDRVKDLLVMSGYLNEADYANVKAIKKAVISFKKEVLGMTGKVNSGWGEEEAWKLLNAVNRQKIRNGAYDELQYEKEMVAALGDEYLKTSEKVAKSNKEIVKSGKGKTFEDIVGNKKKTDKKKSKKKSKKNLTEEELRKKILRESDNLVYSRKSEEIYKSYLDEVKKLITKSGLMAGDVEKDFASINDILAKGASPEKLKVASKQLKQDIEAVFAKTSGTTISDTYNQIDKQIDKLDKKQDKQNEKNNKNEKKLSKEQKKRNRERYDETVKLQQRLESQGYLKYGSYKKGSYSESMYTAIRKFSKDIFGITDRTLSVEELNSMIDELKASHEYDDIVAKNASDAAKAQKKENNKTKIQKQLKGTNSNVKVDKAIRDYDYYYGKYKVVEFDEERRFINALKQYGYIDKLEAGEQRRFTPKTYKAMADFANTVTGQQRDDWTERELALLYGDLVENGTFNEKLKKYAPKKLSSIFDEWGTGFNFTTDADATNMLDTIMPGFSVEKLTGTLLGDAKSGTGILGGLFGGIMDPDKGIGSMLTGAFDLDTDSVGKILGFGEDIGGNLLEGVKSALPNLDVAETLKGAFFDENGNFKIPGSDILEVLKGAFSGAGGAIMSAIGDSFKDEEGNFKFPTELSAIGGTILSGITGFVKDHGGDIWTAITDGLKDDEGNLKIPGIGGIVGSLVTAITGGDAGVTLKPVIDSADFDQKLGGTLTNLITGDSSPVVAIGTSLTSANAITKGIQEDVQSFKTAADETNKKVLQKFDTLADEVRGLSADINNMKIYLDTGALVGGTAQAMGRALGQNRFNKTGGK